MHSEGQRKQETLEKIKQLKVSAILRTTDQPLANNAMSAAVEGGFRLVEFTLTTPGAFSLIQQFSSQPDLRVGAGTVLTIEEARRAVEAGARFLVSPISDPEIITEARRLGVVCIPGTFTPTEMVTVMRLGADMVKLFPSPPGGPEYVRQVRGPLPDVPIFPTAGVTPDNFIEFLDAGCAGVGFTRSLFEPADMAAGNFEAIRSRAATILRRLAEWQREHPVRDG